MTVIRARLAALARGRWIAVWATLWMVGAVAMVRVDIAQRRAAFEADARTVHRLLSQRATQQEAILATLALLAPAAAGPDRPEQRLPALYPQVLAVLRHDRDSAWPVAPLDGSAGAHLDASPEALATAEAASRQAGHAVLGPVDAATGQYTLVLAAQPTSYALRIDLQRMVPTDTWPLDRNGPVRVSLQHAGQTLLLQPGAAVEAQPDGLTPGFVARQTLSAVSQPFELHLQRAAGPTEWPWRGLLVWTLSCAAGGAALAQFQRQRSARRRAEALLRVGQVARLNALGELAGGLAHELNQPLTALLAGTQAARRLLDDDPPDLDTARHALQQAATQARRAADVVARLRRQMEAPDATRREPVDLVSAARQVLALLAPALAAQHVRVHLAGNAPAVQADPVALEQIVHNLVGNACQALAEVPAERRQLWLTVDTAPGQGRLTVRDSGPGISPEALLRLFEPFFTTRPQGLGLGLSLCDTLAQAMGGTLNARAVPGGGAEFSLTLPQARPDTP